MTTIREMMVSFAEYDLGLFLSHFQIPTNIFSSADIICYGYEEDENVGFTDEVVAASDEDGGSDDDDYALRNSECLDSLENGITDNIDLGLNADDDVPGTSLNDSWIENAMDSLQRDVEVFFYFHSIWNNVELTYMPYSFFYKGEN